MFIINNNDKDKGIKDIRNNLKTRDPFGVSNFHTRKLLSKNSQ